MAPSLVRNRDERARHLAHRQVPAGSAGGANPPGALSRPITITVFVPPSSTAIRPNTNPVTTPPTNIGQANTAVALPAPTTVAPPPSPPAAPPVAPPAQSSSSSPTRPQSSAPSPVRPSNTPTVQVTSLSPPAPSDGENGGDNSPVGAAANSGGGLSTGAIVGIVIALLVILIAAVVFFLRRKNIFARKRRRATWLAKGGIMGPKPIPEYDNSNFMPANGEKQAPPPPVPAGFGVSSRATYVPGGATEAAAYAYSTNSYVPQPDLAPPPASYLNNAGTGSPTSGFSPVVMKDGQPTAVLCTFIPTLPDELNINTGDVIRVIAEYDDGWALCANGAGEQGMVPLECLDRSGAVPMPGGGGVMDPRDYKRVSSLAPPSGAPMSMGLAPNRFN